MQAFLRLIFTLTVIKQTMREALDLLGKRKGPPQTEVGINHSEAELESLYYKLLDCAESYRQIQNWDSSPKAAKACLLSHFEWVGILVQLGELIYPFLKRVDMIYTAVRIILHYLHS